jgi:hypothetical protein
MNAPALSQQESDAALERRIEQARIAMMNAETQEARRDWYEEMRWLISQRSPQRIADMEARLPEPWRS